MPVTRPSILVIQLRDLFQDREREQNLFRLCVSRTTSFEFVDAHKHVPITDARYARGVIIAGSALSVFEKGVPRADILARLVRQCIDREIPLLGVCFGAQFIARALGGEVIRDKANEERGSFELRLRQEATHDELLRDLPPTFHAQCAHQDRINCLPDGAIHLASSELCPVQAFRIAGSRVWGLQFHPELTDPKLQAGGIVRTFAERIALRAP